MSQIMLRNVTKEIKGKVILSDINMELHGGKVYGVIGKNGSGKTMLFKSIAGLMKITSGEIIVDGLTLHKNIACIPSLGLVLENAGLYPEFTGKQNLKILSKIKKEINDKEIEEAITRVGLNPNDKRLVKKYSLGMKQRIVIAQAIMERPDVLLLDEPTNALDESGIQLLRKIVNEEKKRGALIIIASHNKEDIDLLCDEVFLMESGSLIKGE